MQGILATPSARRAERKGLVAQWVRGWFGRATSPSMRELAEAVGVSHTLVAQWTEQREKSASLSIVDAMALPPDARIELAQLLAGDTHIVVERPSSTSKQLDDIKLMLASASESAQALDAFREAIADGHIGPEEGARVVHQGWEAVTALVAIIARARQAVAERGSPVRRASTLPAAPVAKRGRR